MKLEVPDDAEILRYLTFLVEKFLISDGEFHKIKAWLPLRVCTC